MRSSVESRHSGDPASYWVLGQIVNRERETFWRRSNTTRAMTMRHQDLPVTLHNDKRGLLTIEDGHLDVLQLSRDGRRSSCFLNPEPILM
jgi:hypothetical protein